ncbi:MAG: hypothetical protein JJU11_04790, partial [Candidatus Sumerlaeia bacterium]|nr:hypothetical protein [Candidatus Sumerlaeia bacterium]
MLSFLPPRPWVAMCVALIMSHLTFAPASIFAESQAKTRETIQLGVLHLEADEIITESEGTQVLRGNVTVNSRVALEGDVTASASSISGNGKISVLNVPGLGDLELVEGPFEVEIDTGRFSGLSSLASRLNFGEIDGDLSEIVITSDGVTVSGMLSYGQESAAVENMSITGSGVSLDDGTIELGKIKFEATGTVINSSIFTADSLTGSAGSVSITLENFEISSALPHVTGGSFQAGGLSGSMSNVNILSKGISAAS